MRLAVCAAGLSGLFVLYWRQSRTGAFNSDGAANVLQAQALLHGNLLLTGWWTSDVSFYTTELPQYALVTAVRGLAPDVVHLCGALSYTLTVLLAALVARGAGYNGAGNNGAGLYGAVVVVAIMVAPGLFGGTQVFLENPDHAGTVVPVLLLFLFLDWARDRDQWYVPVTVCGLLALIQVGDELGVVVATVPVALVYGLRGLTGPSRCRDAALLAAAVVAVPLGQAAAMALRLLGGFDQRPLPRGFLAPLGQVAANARVLWQSIVLLFGANSPGTPRQPRMIGAHAFLVCVADLHVIGLLVAGAGLVAAGAMAVRARRSANHDQVARLLVAAIACTVAAGVFGPLLRSLSNAHEVAVLLPLSAALAGRVLVPRERARRMAAVILGGWLALGLAALCYAAARPSAPVTAAPLADWLVAHGERAGLAGYWQADATTVASGGRVSVAPVTVSGGTGTVSGGGTVSTAEIAADRWESSSAWYQARQRDATFVVAVTDPSSPGGGLPVAAVRARFGPPAAQYQIGQDVVLTYRYNLLTRLSGTALPGKS